LAASFLLLLAVCAVALQCGQPRKVATSEARGSSSEIRTDHLDALRRQAADQVPPSEEGTFLEPDLVDLSAMGANFKFDIRYAGRNNFMGEVMYTRPAAYLQRPAALALAAASQELSERGLGLLIFDAYRPWAVTWLFWEATPVEKRNYVADPSKGSRHNRGCAVDLTLYDLRTGAALPMPSGYDDFSERAHQDFSGGSDEERQNRLILREAMEKQGFLPYRYEWWHFDYAEWRQYPVLNRSFEELAGD
jgi:D-alanyl-D-alanine dipeptidase